MGLILFRLDLGSEVGGGHYSRCLEISRKLVGYDIAFLIKTRGFVDDDTLKKFGHYFIPDDLSYLDEIKYITVLFSSIDAIICDFTNTQTLEQYLDVKNYLSLIHTLVRVVAVIDGRGQGRLIDDFEKFCDLLITPYVGSEKVEGDFIHLLGEKYFIAPSYERGQVANASVKADEVLNLLLTFGQSDPHYLTEFVLKEISVYLTFKKNLAIKIILGNLFAKQRISDIELILNNSNIVFEIIMGPKSMVEYYKWADVAISATGLTKYELAYMGVPSILISASKLDELLQVPFDSMEVSIHLGYFKEIKIGILPSMLDELCCNHDRRLLMSQRGRLLIDDQGANRIASVVMAMCHSYSKRCVYNDDR